MGSVVPVMTSLGATKRSLDVQIAVTHKPRCFIINRFENLGRLAP
jgi:hypothetical protein